MIKLNYISSTTSPPWGRGDKIKLHILHYQLSLGEGGDKYYMGERCKTIAAWAKERGTPRES